MFAVGKTVLVKKSFIAVLPSGGKIKIKPGNKVIILDQLPDGKNFNIKLFDLPEVYHTVKKEYLDI